MNKDKPETDQDRIVRRLDALIRLMLEIHFDKKNKFNLTAAVKALKSCGLAPKEIADILGKKTTDIAPFLYPKDHSKKEKATESSKPAREVESNI